MPPEIPGVRGLVARALLASPDTSSRELYATAVGRYPALAELTVQQFHGRYVLQVRRELKRRPPRRPRLVPDHRVRDDLVRDDLVRDDLAGDDLTGDGRVGAGEESRDAGAPAGDLLAFASSPAGRREAPRDGSTTPPQEVPDGEAEASAGVGGPAADSGLSLVERARPSAEVEPPPPADPRAATRNLFYRLALELEMAETRDELVRVVFGIDRYVDEALSVVQR